MCDKAEQKWFGIKFGEGQWLHDGNGLRVAFEDQQEANQVLTTWEQEKKTQGGIVKEFLPAPPGCVLYS